MISAFGVIHKAVKLPDGSWVRLRVNNPRHSVEAMRNAKNIGYLDIDRVDGVVSHVKVRRKYRRKGVATGMWNRAKSTGWDPAHSPIQSRKGKKWAETVGD